MWSRRLLKRLWLGSRGRPRREHGPPAPIRRRNAGLAWATWALWGLVAPGWSSPATGGEPSAGSAPLHERIDQIVAARVPQPVAGRASDAEFLRRVYLDLVGRIPSSAEAREFLGDPAPDKRRALVDRLLDSPEYARRMQIVFDLMLMERRADTHVPGPEWREYLRASFAANKPYDQLVTEILTADGTAAAARPAAKFFLDRGGDPNTLTRDVGRLLFGVDLGCAQCHDHPLISDYAQWQYYGLFAFFHRSAPLADKAQLTALGEKADGAVSYQSVFLPEAGSHGTGPKLPDGRAVSEPAVPGELAYLVAPAEGVRGLPRYSRRQQLARELAAAKPAAFDRNLANRLWALLWGRGLVEPVDLHHADNPPAVPELLDALSTELAAGGYDVRRFLREVALSQTYQRASEWPEGMAEPPPPESLAVAPLEPLSAEQLAWSLLELSGVLPQERRAARAGLAADRRLDDLLRADPERRRLEAEWIERAVHEKLLPHVAQFVALFAPQPGAPAGEFEASVHQALFLANGTTLRDWLRAEYEGSLMVRMAGLADPVQVAEELYLSVLSRPPSADEAGEVQSYLGDSTADERKARLDQLAWALVASAEFRLNH